ncbi:hypothetical protein J1N35_004645 [Gossypium stocksii]|uniref:RNase H type-1 domain-containing protein n=1 Tax=Gossypium stocksii TaxID=47602 RepID=A0A9D3WEJ1_9ROSI|nr:hypothetical protein J1N35_004645 [Gossypium stocksii]
MSFYLNTDGVVHFVSGFSAAVTIAELWGILDGLRFLQKQGYDEIIIQSDNLENVISICDSRTDALAKMALTKSETLHMFEELPLELKEILKEDCTFDIVARN